MNLPNGTLVEIIHQPYGMTYNLVGQRGIIDKQTTFLGKPSYRINFQNDISSYCYCFKNDVKPVEVESDEWFFEIK